MRTKCMPQNRPALQTRPVRQTDGSTHCYCWHHAEGSILPGQAQVVSLEYDPSQLPQQGRYDTNVLVQMSEQPYAKVSTPLLPHRHALQDIRQSVTLSECRLCRRMRRRCCSFVHNSARCGSHSCRTQWAPASPCCRTARHRCPATQLPYQTGHLPPPQRAPPAFLWNSVSGAESHDQCPRQLDSTKSRWGFLIRVLSWAYWICKEPGRHFHL